MLYTKRTETLASHTFPTYFFQNGRQHSRSGMRKNSPAEWLACVVSEKIVWRFSWKPHGRFRFSRGSPIVFLPTLTPRV